MLTLVRDIRTNAGIGLQRLALTYDGQAVERDGRKLRMSLGSTAGGAVMLDPFENVTLSLSIGEGVESCLAGRQLGFNPVWALGSAGAIKTFPVLDAVESITIFCETDDKGANKGAAEECSDRWNRAGREVIFATPTFRGDMNDVLQRIQS